MSQSYISAGVGHSSQAPLGYFSVAPKFLSDPNTCQQCRKHCLCDVDILQSRVRQLEMCGIYKLRLKLTEFIWLIPNQRG
jgi:hypothetical protein